jgi:hypothetical protein
MVFQPGQSGNPRGGGNSTRRKGNAEIFYEIKNRGYLDPLLTLAKAQHESEDEGRRIAAAAALAPYAHPKLQALPAPRFIATPIDVPDFQTVEDAENFLAKVTVLVARGELDFQSALELSTMAKNWIDAKNAHLIYAFPSSANSRSIIRAKILGGEPPICVVLLPSAVLTVT